MKTDYLERILTARVYDVAIESPLERGAEPVAPGSKNDVLLKREDMQPVFSFKLRGAYNKMAQLPAAALRRGVIAASAGNHAQGVALAAQKLGCTATIVMPVTTPQIKVEAVGRPRRAGGAVRRFLRRGLPACAGDREAREAHLRAPLRRPGRDRRAGHHRHGDPAPAHRTDRCHLRRRRRRRADRRHRRLRQAPAARDPDHRRRAGGRGCHVPVAARPGSGCACRRSGCSATAWR